MIPSFPKNFLFFLFVIFSFYGCKTVRNTTTTGQSFYLENNSNLVVLPVAGNRNKESLRVFEAVAKHLKDECITVQFLPQIDYDLKVRNIETDQLMKRDPQTLAIFNAWMPNSYFMELIPMNITSSGNKLPAGKSKWITRITPMNTGETWEYLTDAQITSVKLNQKDVNVFASQYYLGIKESLDYLMETSMPGCD